MGKKKADIKDQVEQRRKAETEARAAKAKPVAVKQLEISDEHLLGYLNENRVGDAKLYCRLHRDTVIYVKYWERFLIWGGHHWIEDDYEAAFQRIEEVCELYLRLAEHKQMEADEATRKTSPKSRASLMPPCGASTYSGTPTDRKNSCLWCAASVIRWWFCPSTSTSATTSKPVPMA